MNFPVTIIKRNKESALKKVQSIMTAQGEAIAILKGAPDLTSSHLKIFYDAKKKGN